MSVLPTNFVDFADGFLHENIRRSGAYGRTKPQVRINFAEASARVFPPVTQRSRGHHRRGRLLRVTNERGGIKSFSEIKFFPPKGPLTCGYFRWEFRWFRWGPYFV